MNKLKMQKVKYAFSVVSGAIAVAIILLSLIFKGNKIYNDGLKSMIIMFYFMAIGLSALIVFFECRRIKKGRSSFSWTGFACSLLLMSVSVVSFIIYMGGGKMGLIFMIGGLCGAFINYFFRIFVISVVGFSNIDYKGQAPIKFYRKLLEPLLQIALLPISVTLQILCIPFSFFRGDLLSESITYNFLVKLLKKEGRVYVNSYNVGASDYQVKVKKEYEIKDDVGKVVGTIETDEYETRHDDGERYIYKNEDGYKMSYGYGFVALPLRLFCLYLSIIAIFIPKLYVSAIATNAENYVKSKYILYDVICF